jgi:adenylate cyclase
MIFTAIAHVALHISGWTDDAIASRREGIQLARRALRVGGDDPSVLGNVAYAFGYFGEDIDAAIELADRALTLNPSFAQGWYLSGCLRLWAGQPEPAISHFEISLRLSPNARRATIFMSIGLGHFFARQFDTPWQCCFGRCKRFLAGNPLHALGVGRAGGELSRKSWGQKIPLHFRCSAV